MDGVGGVFVVSLARSSLSRSVRAGAVFFCCCSFSLRVRKKKARGGAPGLGEGRAGRLAERDWDHQSRQPLCVCVGGAALSAWDANWGGVWGVGGRVWVRCRKARQFSRRANNSQGQLGAREKIE